MMQVDLNRRIPPSSFVPSAARDDVCDCPLARNLVTLTLALACEVIMTYAATGERQSFTETLRDFAVRPFSLD